MDAKTEDSLLSVARISASSPGLSLPLIIESLSDTIDLARLAGEHRDELREKLLRYGGILFRGGAIVHGA
jgi:hypothetical protein